MELSQNGSFEATVDNTPKSTSQLVDALTTIESASFATDLARTCLQRQLHRAACGEASFSNGEDLDAAAKLEFQRANVWLDEVLGPLSGDLVSLSQRKVLKHEKRSY